ncbi:unnamed protein product [Somion occarium]|uniref:Hemimethylated DNA-binding domain-containing protein n=1 Tax=Somion occarium TaxID=3059160 RepID=A0ABP1CK69_9APHY
MTIPTFPVEIYSEILKHIPTTDDSGVKLLLAFLQSNSRLRAAALAPEVWEPHYHARYVHSVEERERQRRDAAGNNWRQLYIQRRTLDRKALQSLDEIRKDRRDRHNKVATITDFSFDIWDAIRQESRIPIPLCFRGSYGEQDESAVPPDALPRQFWANTILGVIARRQAVGIWGRTFSEQGDVPFEEALASLSSVYSVSVKEITVMLDDIFEHCKQELQKLAVCLDPNDSAYDLWELCIQIRSVLRDMGFRVANSHRFSRLFSQFPHSFLLPGHRDTIPMSLIYVFVSICTRLGINASPVNFPGSVLAHVASSDGNILFDMCSARRPLRTSNTADLQSFVRSQVGGATVTVLNEESTGPADSATMLSRAFNNIMSFIRFERMHDEDPASLERREKSFYLITLCRLLFIQNQFDGLLPSPPHTMPLDDRAVILDVLAPLLPEHIRSPLQDACEERLRDAAVKSTKVYSRKDVGKVDYFVGLCFRHTEFQYTGCIFGWDATCNASEEWIREMKVDRLKHGRDQPFYVAYADDAHSRYVAQENIIPVVPSEADLRRLYLSRSAFGRNFTGLADDGLAHPGRLSMSDEMRAVYPDDDDFGRKWVQENRNWECVQVRIRRNSSH